MNITSAKITGEDTDIDYCNMLIEFWAEVFDCSEPVKFTVEIEERALAAWLTNEKGMWPPDCSTHIWYDGKSGVSEDDLIEWLTYSLMGEFNQVKMPSF